MTTNQLYRGMNRRFDRRARFLARFGYKYNHVFVGRCDNEYFHPAHLGVFVRQDYHHAEAITASAVLYASPTCWRSLLASSLRRF